MRKKLGKKDTTNTVIQEYKPETGGIIADGTRIGLAFRWYMVIGTVVGHLTDAKTSGGGQIVETLQKFGFRGRQDELDGDHVHEIQMGGEDM